MEEISVTAVAFLVRPYSSNAAALPDAAKTGKLTLRPFSVVESLMYDDKTKKLKGVRVIDAETNQSLEFFSKLVFLNASTLGSTQILLQSKTNEFPNGLANSSGVLGHYLMDHHAYIGAVGGYSGLKESFYYGTASCQRIYPEIQKCETKRSALPAWFWI
jgi:choline dehydrogenase-like flavoprotein